MALGDYDEAAVRDLGDVTLKAIAHELVTTLRNSTMVDWTIRETVKAELRVKVKNLLRRYHYPPDRQEAATTTVLQQAEILCGDWAGNETDSADARWGTTAGTYLALDCRETEAATALGRAETPRLDGKGNLAIRLSPVVRCHAGA